MVTNRVWDPTAAAFVSWRTGVPDTTGIEYPGPDTFANTSDYAVTRGVLNQVPHDAQLHDLRHAPVSLWQLDGSLVDEQGIEDMSLDTGTLRYGPGPALGTQAAYFDGVTGLVGVSTPAPASLRILGDVTVECLVKPTGIPSGNANAATCVACVGDVTLDTEANNVLWWTRFTQLTLYEPEAAWEDTAGANDELRASGYHLGQDRWHHFAVVRVSGGVGATAVYIYVDGTLIASDLTLNDAVGGSLGVVRMGRVPNGGGNFSFVGYLSSVKITPSALTAAQVLAEAQLTLPPSVRP